MLFDLLLLSPLPLFAFAYWSVHNRMLSDGPRRLRAEQAVIMGGALLYLLVLQQSADGWIRWVPLGIAAVAICVGSVGVIIEIAAHARR